MIEGFKKKINLSKNALRVLEKRYLQKNRNGKIIENPEQMFKRVAKNIALADKIYGKSEKEIEKIEKKFYQIMTDLLFLPNSPTLMNAGTDLGQLSACFVLSVDDSIDSIYEAIKHAAIIHKSGGGTGFSFSRIRPKGSPVGSTSGVASGPVSFMRVFDASTEAIKQGGRRRGANMGILNVTHPDILEFINCKEKEGELRNFNISVAVTDEFMQAAQKGEDYDLIDPRTGENTGKLNAGEILDKIAQMAWKNGEPGIIFLDRINQFNPTPRIKIESTNPCVTSDTWIMTASGPRRVVELVGKKFVAVINGKRWETDEKGFFKTGVKPVYRIKTLEGFELCLTKDHPVMKVKEIRKNKIKTEWTPAGNLRPGDKIIVNNHRDFGGWNGEYTEEEGYLIGLLLGDGVVKKDKIVLSSWGNSKGAVATRKLAYSYVDTFPHRADFRGWIPVKEREEYRLSTAYLKKLADGLGLAQSRKRITEKIEKASSRFYRGLLKGLFDADGSIQGDQSKGVSIRLSQSNLEVLKAVQRMLLRLGIFSKIYVNRRNSGEKELPDGKGGLKKYHIKAQHELVISNENILYFYKKIGFGDLNKMEKLEDAIKNYKRNLNQERFIATIEDTLPEGVKEVYDIQIPGINAFDANGFYIHNCGEQPLLPYESCNLGSINLTRMVEDGKINWDKLKDVVHTAVHFLDNVIDVNKYPLPQIEENTKANRKIGLGVMGFADTLIKLGIPYNSRKALNLAEKLMSFVQDESKKASQQLARERGVFPNFKESIWEKKNIKLRNATTTTIAPTGSISMIADCSSGIEPIFSLVYYKEVLGGERLLYVNEEFEKIARDRGFYSRELMEKIANNNGSCQEIPEIPDDVKKIFVTALDISYQDHVKMQAAFQKYTDNAVSKTINFPNKVSKDDVKKSFILAYKLGCKGITIYRDQSREEQVIRAAKEREKKTLTTRPRPKITYGMTREIKTGCGDLYVTINEDEKGEPFEVFAQLGKSGGCAASQTEAIGRLSSLALRSGIPWTQIVKQLKGISCDRPWGFGKNKVLSCADAIGKAIELFKEEKNKMVISPPLSEERISEKSDKTKKGLETPGLKSERILGACPECGSSAIEYSEGCFVCRSCGYSECD